MPYWITQTLASTPALAWMFLALGLPWALVLLPRAHWRDRTMVACLTLAFGPMLLTAWMLFLGVLPAPFLRLDTTLGGTAVIAGIGWALVWRKGRSLPHPNPSSSNGEAQENVSPLRLDEKLLMLLVGIMWVVNWLSTAYWPFTAYDALWVYGYEGRLYALVNQIPAKIGYYPQFLPLQYTYLQLAVGGIDDHAARAVVPWLFLGSILAVYLLGSRLFNRRAGIFAAALWALYPHVGEWTRYGDLEVVLTFLFTGAAAFFLMAWVALTPAPSPSGRGGAASPLFWRRYAVIAGLLLGTGMWTKPTMGAFIWGVALLLAAELVRLRFDWRRWWPRFSVVAVMGIASIPLGAVWYVRNALLGHPIIDFPTGFWLTLAARSGAEFGWPLLALIVLLLWVWYAGGARKDVAVRMQTLAGLALVLAGVLPSIIQPHRMGILEWLAFGAGLFILARSLADYAKPRWTPQGRAWTERAGWLALLALPYFVTWFYSYSYHYRLSFAIVPLMLMPTALILAHWTSGLRARRHPLYIAALILAGLPGVVAPLYDAYAGWDWLWTDKLPDDHARYVSGNAALMSVVDGLNDYQKQHGALPGVVAPGVRRLPFFFPTADFRVENPPTTLNELNNTTFYVYGLPETPGTYEVIGAPKNQVLASLSMTSREPDERPLWHRAWWLDDGIFNYTVYQSLLERRFIRPKVLVKAPEQVIFGGSLRYLGYDIGGGQFWPNRHLIMHLYWQTIAPPPQNYTFYVHLRDKDGKLWATWDGPVSWTQDGNYYSTQYWETGEYISDYRDLALTDPNTPVGEDYTISIGVYNWLTGERVPLLVNGQPAGDTYTLPEKVSVLATPPN
jgi:4-amino-4-deoxy-L-arabinose transferase-like glycosyltransferase